MQLSAPDPEIPVPYDVIIVGAGMSGLAAAYYMLRNHPKTRVLIVEARDRIGGRVNPVSFQEENETSKGYIDMGASFIHGVIGNPMFKIAHKLNLKTSPLEFGAFDASGNTGPAIIHPQGELGDPAAAAKVLLTLGNVFFNTLPANSRESPDEVPSAGASLADVMFKEDSALYEGLTEEEKEMINPIARATQGWTGAPMDYVSLKYWYFNQDTQGGDTFLCDSYYFILRYLRDQIELHGGQIILQSEVTEIEVVNDISVKVSTVHPQTRQTQEFIGQTTLVTLPLGVLKYNPPKFTPALPRRRLEAIQRVGVGLLDKVILYYSEAWWKGPGKTFKKLPDSLILLPDSNDPTRLFGPRRGRSSGTIKGSFPPRDQDYLEKNPSSIMIEDLSSLSGIPALQFMIGADAGDPIEECSDEEIGDWAHGIAAEYLGPFAKEGHIVVGPLAAEFEIPKPTRVYATRWRSDPYAFGFYSYVPNTPQGEASTPLDYIELSHSLWGRVFFAGEHTIVDDYATAHGAYNSGVREGRRIALALKDLVGHLSVEESWDD